MIEIYTTKPGESIMGIALRQLGDERRWGEIRFLNEERFPNMAPNSYYPVGTELKMPPKQGWNAGIDELERERGYAADRVRQALDRESCPALWIGIAVRAVMGTGAVPQGKAAAQRQPPDEPWVVSLMGAAAKSGHAGTLRLAAHLAGAEPCEKCGYVWNHCKCAK